MRKLFVVSITSLLALCIASLLGLCSVSHAQTFGPKVNAAIIITSGEKNSCTFGTIQDGWMAYVAPSGPYCRSRTRYLSSFDKCVVIRVKLPIGSTIGIGGIMEILGPKGGLSPNVNEDCFNVEGYSVGLADVDPSTEIDPAANQVNPQGYGLFWDMTDTSGSLEGNGRAFKVVGCNGPCPQSPTKYNTDTGTQPNDCVWLAPIQ